MAAQRGLHQRPPVVHQDQLLAFGERVEVRAHLRDEVEHLPAVAGGGGVVVVGDVGREAPVGPLVDLILVGGDEPALAHGARLVVDDVVRVGEPREQVRRRRRLELVRPAAVGAEDGAVVLPDRLQPEVVVNAPVGQKHAPRQLVVLGAAGERPAAELVERGVEVEHERREGDGEGRGAGDGVGQAQPARRRAADLPVAHVPGVEDEVDAGLKVGRAEDEVRPAGGPHVREVLQCEAAHEPVLVDVGQEVRRRLPVPPEPLQVRGREPRPDERLVADVRRAEGARRRLDLLGEVDEDARLVAPEPRPRARQQPVRDRPARDRRDGVDAREQPDLVQPPQRPDVKERRPEPPARQTQPHVIPPRPDRRRLELRNTHALAGLRAPGRPAARPLVRSFSTHNSFSLSARAGPRPRSLRLMCWQWPSRLKVSITREDANNGHETCPLTHESLRIYT